MLVNLKPEQPTLVVNRSCTLCVQEQTVSCTGVVVHCWADSWRPKRFWLCQIDHQVHTGQWLGTLIFYQRLEFSPTLLLLAITLLGTGLPSPPVWRANNTLNSPSPLVLLRTTSKRSEATNDSEQSQSECTEELLNRVVTEVFCAYFLCTWLCVTAGRTETDTMSLLGLDSRWGSKSTGSSRRRLEV